MNAADHAPSGDAARGATQILRDILNDLERSTMTEESAAASQTSEDPSPTAPRAKLGDVIDRLDERAFGLLILLLALPCSLPFVYVLPQIAAVPMLALAGQLAAGRHHPWLPKRLHEREFNIETFDRVIVRAQKYGGWIERLARPRLTAITGPTGARIAGALMLVPAASILTPLPSTNTVPGIGVAIASLGLIERDGVLVILGLLIGFIWVGLLLFLGLEAAQLIMDWL